MNILLVGSGGREHALAWKIAQSPLVTRLVVAPGNPGMAKLGEMRPDLKATDAEGLAALAREMKADLVVVGPESALAEGLADRLNAAGIPCFGPTQAAAQLETSKAFSKAFLQRHGIPTAGYGVYEDVASAKAALDQYSAPYVIKADGLAAGKGVAISPDRADAEAEIERMLGGRFGSAGSRVVIEEFMDGEEGSLFALSDGTRAVLFGGAQDHKRAFDGDLGPNTGGMGAYCPASLVDDDKLHWIEENVLLPTLITLNRMDTLFKGVLYAGLMMTPQGPRVLEYNARFGDPECQPLLSRLKTDLVDVIEATIDEKLCDIEPLVWDERPAVCVVMASEGYPGSYEKGFPISGLDEAAKLPDVKVFHAGTKLVDGVVTTNGGRVLSVVALGDTVADAKRKAYEAVAKISWQGAWNRTDVADKEIKAVQN